jgi:hypothetical protein
MIATVTERFKSDETQDFPNDVQVSGRTIHHRENPFTKSGAGSFARATAIWWVLAASGHR